MVLDTQAGIASMRSSQHYLLAATGYFDSGNSSLIAALEEALTVSRNDILLCFIDHQSIVRLRRAVQIAMLCRTRIATTAAIAENFVSAQAKNDGEFVAMGMTSLPSKAIRHRAKNSNGLARARNRNSRVRHQRDGLSLAPYGGPAHVAKPRRIVPITAEAQLQQIRCQAGEATDSQRMARTGGKSRLRDIVQEQLDPPVIAVPDVGQFPRVISQRGNPLEHKPQTSLKLPVDRSSAPLLHQKGVQKHLRNQNVIASRGLAVAAIRIRLKQDFTVNGARIFFQPLRHSGTVEICRQGR
jgi:hypothetical protein